MLPRVEVVELVDAVEHVGDQLLQEEPRRDADLAAQAPGDGRGERVEVAVVDQRTQPRLALRGPSA